MPTSEGNKSSYAELLTTTFAGASPQALQGHPPEVLMEVMQRLSEVPWVFPPTVTCVVPRIDN